eukprot:TRINITY_DN3058_c0_g1_i1.p1 TRINITY_DN3058_c0_g1~~TRINITY_DN3058_c0_g1_i1.p1  ORF type:complete len:422 (-),score=45.59 TRINITY_DN3058_c0_g1_i1:592-1857(-)
MDSALNHGHPQYNSIPEGSLTVPRQTSHRSNTIWHQMARLRRSSPVSHLLKIVTVVTLITASVFVLSSPCISCDFLSFRNRIYNFTPHRRSLVNLKFPTGYTYFQPHRRNVIGSYERYPDAAFRRLSTPVIPFWNRQDAAPEVGDYVIEEGEPTGDCSAGRLCRARLVVAKEGGYITIQAGYNISGLNGVVRPVDSDTKARVSEVSTLQALTWASRLVSRVRDRLGEVNCVVPLVAVAMAIFEGSKVAATCPKTDDALCHQLETVGHCTIPTPTPVPLDSCEEAFEECEFTFKGESALATFSVDGAPDKSFTPVIVAKDADVNLGVLNSNNVVPEFIEESGTFPITDFGSQRFAPTQFKPYYIWQEQGSGIGHQTFHADQQELARGRCIRIFFTDIQLVNPYSNLNNVPISENKCVVFRTE